MADTDLTEIILIVDRSGSMISIQKDAEGGINQFIKEQQELPGRALLTLAQFDSEYELLHNGVPIKDINKYTLSPRGMTALLDAIGKTINEVKNRHRDISENSRPGKVIVAIVTDGMENASREFNRQHIFHMISGQRKDQDWQFIFLAANQDAIAQATSMGIRADHATNFVANSQSTKNAFALASHTHSIYRTSGVIGSLTANVDESFTSDGKLKVSSDVVTPDVVTPDVSKDTDSSNSSRASEKQ